MYIDFKNKKIRINLNLPIKAAEKTEMTEVLENVDEDRKLAIQATIVRYIFISFSSCPNVLVREEDA